MNPNMRPPNMNQQPNPQSQRPQQPPPQPQGPQQPPQPRPTQQPLPRPQPIQRPVQQQQPQQQPQQQQQQQPQQPQQPPTTQSPRPVLRQQKLTKPAPVQKEEIVGPVDDDILGIPVPLSGQTTQISENRLEDAGSDQNFSDEDTIKSIQVTGRRTKKAKRAQMQGINFTDNNLVTAQG